MSDDDERIGRQEGLQCLKCTNMTRHTLRAMHVRPYLDCDGEELGGEVHDLLTCNGCGATTYRATTWQADDGERYTDYFPPRNEFALRRVARGFSDLQPCSALALVYEETVSAFNSKLAALTGAGVRLLIEGVCNKQGVTGGNVVDKNGSSRRQTTLQGKINGLVEQGFIGARQAEALHEIRFLGNEAAHQLEQPAMATLEVALDIVDHLLVQIYDQPARARALANRPRSSFKTVSRRS